MPHYEAHYPSIQGVNMTIFLTLIGVIVFIISLFTAGFKSAGKRLAMFAIAGLALDAILFSTVTIAAYLSV